MTSSMFRLRGAPDFACLHTWWYIIIFLARFNASQKSDSPYTWQLATSRIMPHSASYCYYHHPRLCPPAVLPWPRPACFQLAVSCSSVQLSLPLLI